MSAPLPYCDVFPVIWAVNALFTVGTTAMTAMTPTIAPMKEADTVRVRFAFIGNSLLSYWLSVQARLSVAVRPWSAFVTPESSWTVNVYVALEPALSAERVSAPFDASDARVYVLLSAGHAPDCAG